MIYYDELDSVSLLDEFLVLVNDNKRFEIQFKEFLQRHLSFANLYQKYLVDRSCESELFEMYKELTEQDLQCIESNILPIKKYQLPSSFDTLLLRVFKPLLEDIVEKLQQGDMQSMAQNLIMV